MAAAPLVLDPEETTTPGSVRPPPIPIELAKQVGIAKLEPHWAESRFFPSPDGSLLVVASGESDGRGIHTDPPYPLLVAWWDGASYTPLGGHMGELHAYDAFVTPDGQLRVLNLQGLWRFSAGHFTLELARPERRWRTSRRLPEDPIQFENVDRVVGDSKPPWIALDRLGVRRLVLGQTPPPIHSG
jgi:hypothetical protein